MTFPFYVNPAQMSRDKSEFARKGIARGKSLITFEYQGGILLIAENPLQLQKIGEIYDRIAFAGVGKFNEFDRLRKMGVQWADVEGYRFSREDVRGQALANLYSQLLGDEFTRSPKPLEVEIVVAEVGDDAFAGDEANAIYRISFDGSVQDQHRFCAIGGGVDELTRYLQENYQEGMDLAEAVRFGRLALRHAGHGAPELPAASLEVAALERSLPGRRFHRLPTQEVANFLG